MRPKDTGLLTSEPPAGGWGHCPPPTTPLPVHSFSRHLPPCKQARQPGQGFLFFPVTQLRVLSSDPVAIIQLLLQLLGQGPGSPSSSRPLRPDLRPLLKTALSQLRKGLSVDTHEEKYIRQRQLTTMDFT